MRFSMVVDAQATAELPLAKIGVGTVESWPLKALEIAPMFTSAVRFFSAGSYA